MTATEKAAPRPLDALLKDAVWSVIRTWDISPANNGTYHGATGTDAEAIVRAVLAALPVPAGAVEALTCDEQFALATHLAGDLGYDLVPEPPHPDTPRDNFGGPSPSTAGDEVQGVDRCPVVSEELVEQAWSDLLNVDDRTSPEEYPDMALIKFDELREIIATFVEKGRVQLSEQNATLAAHAEKAQREVEYWQIETKGETAKVEFRDKIIEQNKATGEASRALLAEAAEGLEAIRPNIISGSYTALSISVIDELVTKLKGAS